MRTAIRNCITKQFILLCVTLFEVGLLSSDQILRKVFGTASCKEGWRIRNSKELQKLIERDLAPVSQFFLL